MLVFKENGQKEVHRNSFEPFSFGNAYIHPYIFQL